MPRDERDPLPAISRDRYHTMLAGHTVWTGELFEAATTYLSAKLTMVSMATLAAVKADADVLLPEDSRVLRGELFKKA